MSALSKFSDIMNRYEANLEDLADHKIASTCKEITMACSFLPRLKARTDNFQTNLLTLSTDIQASLIEISNLASQELNCLKVVNYSNQSVQYEYYKE